MLRPGLVLALCAAAAACAGDDAPPDEPPLLVDELNALPGVTAEWVPTETDGFTYYVLRFTQPFDHADPGGPTFEQKVSLLHYNRTQPMVVLTSGYWDYYADSPYEVTRVLYANQISIEHRFFGESRPEPADWSKLTIEQMAADQHRIIETLRAVYPAAYVTTGGSKGGMTAVYHRRFYPDDVEGTIAYVAPLSLGAPDTRYAAYLDTIGPAQCRQRVRDLAVEMLANRRTMLQQEAQAQRADRGIAYTRVTLPMAVESAIVSFEWSFWQYIGVLGCVELPAVTASDADLWEVLDAVSPPSDSSDDQLALFDAYYYQAYHQLGYPDGGAAYLEPYLQFTDEDYEQNLPYPIPAYDDGAAMRDIDTWVQAEGDGLAFIYGQWDPWTAGAFSLGGATDSVSVTQAQGSHSARMSFLAPGDQDAVHAKLEAWTGVPVYGSSARAREVAPPPREPRVPPAMIRALRAR